MVVAQTVAPAEGEAGSPSTVAISSVRALPADGVLGLSRASGAAAGAGVTEEVGRWLLFSRSGGGGGLPLASSRPSQRRGWQEGVCPNAV